MFKVLKLKFSIKVCKLIYTPDKSPKWSKIFPLYSLLVNINASWTFNPNARRVVYSLYLTFIFQSSHKISICIETCNHPMFKPNQNSNKKNVDNNILSIFKILQWIQFERSVIRSSHYQLNTYCNLKLQNVATHAGQKSVSEYKNERAHLIPWTLYPTKQSNLPHPNIERVKRGPKSHPSLIITTLIEANVIWRVRWLLPLTNNISGTKVELHSMQSIVSYNKWVYFNLACYDWL